MLFRTPFVLAAAASALTAVSAQLKVLSPGGPDLWWVADSENLLVWNCNESQVQSFTVLVNNPSLEAPLAIIADQPNFVCSLIVTKDQISPLSVGNGYTVELANPLNNTDVYAQSLPFEIKPAGSPYPTTTVSPAAAT
ncbi:hypothetical protein GYMLUDRAFT_103742, partial [Collybiopsis luxurians FD-317 M1]